MCEEATREIWYEERAYEYDGHHTEEPPHLVRVQLVRWETERDATTVLRYWAVVDGEEKVEGEELLGRWARRPRATRRAIAKFDELVLNHPRLAPALFFTQDGHKNDQNGQ